MTLGGVPYLLFLLRHARLQLLPGGKLVTHPVLLEVLDVLPGVLDVVEGHFLVVAAPYLAGLFQRFEHFLEFLVVAHHLALVGLVEVESVDAQLVLLVHVRVQLLPPDVRLDVALLPDVLVVLLPVKAGTLVGVGLDREHWKLRGDQYEERPCQCKVYCKKRTHDCSKKVNSHMGSFSHGFESFTFSESGCVLWGSSSANKTYKMTSKLLLSAVATPKREPDYQQLRPRRFTRKRDGSESSIQSKRSKDESKGSRYIKNPQGSQELSVMSLTSDSFSLFEQIETPTVLEEAAKKLQGNHTERSKPRTMYQRSNGTGQVSKADRSLQMRVEVLQNQLTAKQGECTRYRLQYDQQVQARRRAQFETKELRHELRELERTNEELRMDNRQLQQDKEYLVKHIEFLEKVQFDNKERQLQSYRQKHLTSEIVRLENELKMDKSERQFFLQQQIQILKEVADEAMEKARAMTWLCQTLQAKSERFSRLLKQSKEKGRQTILASQQYVSLKERYRRFVENYKQTKSQNWQLRRMLEGQQASFQLSESSGSQEEGQ